jgi:hypothetical protein
MARFGDSVIPYTHWSYFPSREAAEECKPELDALDCLVGIERIEHPLDGKPWLLRAARNVEVDLLVERHAEVKAIVERHGGFYDGGESGWLETTPGQLDALTDEIDRLDGEEAS